MEKQADGFWTVTTPALVPGLHYYTLIIDGAEVSDTNSRSFVGGGKHASMVEVPEPGSTYYSIQDVPHGQVREIWYNSKVTGTWRHALVYLPPNTTQRQRCVIPRFIFNTAQARMKPVGYAREMQISSLTISVPLDASQ